MADEHGLTRSITARLDGNAAGGPLSEIFGVDVTDVVLECRHCGATGMVAETVVELDADGLLMLCRPCGRLLLSYVWSGARRSVRFPGLAQLIMPA